MEVAVLTTGDIINFQRTVNEQIQAITRARSRDAPASRELMVLDELLDGWRDEEYETVLLALKRYREAGGNGLDIEGHTFRALMSLAKRKNLLDTMEEAYL